MLDFALSPVRYSIGKIAERAAATGWKRGREAQPCLRANEASQPASVKPARSLPSLSPSLLTRVAATEADPPRGRLAALTLPFAVLFGDPSSNGPRSPCGGVARRGLRVGSRGQRCGGSQTQKQCCIPRRPSWCQSEAWPSSQGVQRRTPSLSPPALKVGLITQSPLICECPAGPPRAASAFICVGGAIGRLNGRLSAAGSWGPPPPGPSLPPPSGPSATGQTCSTHRETKKGTTYEYSTYPSLSRKCPDS